MDMNSYAILKQGSNLLNSKCHLKLIVERNMDSWKSQNVPDFSVHGTLSRLEAVLDLQQYQLVRGFLSYNLGECIDDLNVETTYNWDSRSNLLTDVDVPVKMIRNVSVVRQRCQFKNFVFRKLPTNGSGQIHRLHSTYKTCRCAFINRLNRYHTVMLWPA